MRILLTGATGFVGDALLPELKAAGHTVRCLVRSSKSHDRLRASGEDVVVGDVSKPETLPPALHGCDAAYYLIHSMDGRGDYAARDRTGAENFRAAATTAGLRCIIYLGGLANPEHQNLSEHLQSRFEVGEILRSGPVPCIEFRASMVIGKGSLSFRMVEHLCRRLPIMLCPKWLSTPTQPIAISDLLHYLVAGLPLAAKESQAIEIGGSESTTLLAVLKEYCRQCELRRVMIPIPLLTPTLSAHWLGLVTPETAAVGRSLIEGLRHPTRIRDTKARECFPDIDPLSMAQAIKDALAAGQAEKPA